MITLYYGDRENTPKPILENIPGVFRLRYNPKWMSNPLAVELTEIIERVKVESPWCFHHYAYGQVSPYMISAGVQHLLLMLNCEDLRNENMFDCAYFGDNCVPYIQRIAEQVDLDIFVDRFLQWDEALLQKIVVRSDFTKNQILSMKQSMQDRVAFKRFLRDQWIANGRPVLEEVEEE